jgi:hypothetical protein
MVRRLPDAYAPTASLKSAAKSIVIASLVPAGCHTSDWLRISGPSSLDRQRSTSSLGASTTQYSPTLNRW